MGDIGLGKEKKGWPVADTTTSSKKERWLSVSVSVSVCLFLFLSAMTVVDLSDRIVVVYFLDGSVIIDICGVSTFSFVLSVVLLLLLLLFFFGSQFSFSFPQLDTPSSLLHPSFFLVLLLLSIFSSSLSLSLSFSSIVLLEYIYLLLAGLSFEQAKTNQ